uniref:RNA-binding protein 44 n=1 Tax=Semicossyphus pulcher TaxID=241346 RepID=UPI0037E72DFE
MAVLQTVWPGSWTCWQVPLPYELTVPRPSYSASDYAGVVVPSRVIPYYYKTVIDNPSAIENRRFLLDRSIFDLVDSQPYLSLTDPKLLGWYLCLSQEDRKHIQDEGGFHLFLQRHPALELSQHHVYVKYNLGCPNPAQPAVTSKKHKGSGGKMCTCEMSHTQPELNMNPNKVRETLSLFDDRNNRTEQMVHLNDGLQAAFNNPVTPEPSHHKGPSQYQLNKESPSRQMAGSSTAAVYKHPAALASFSVDLELERCKQKSEVSPLQSDWPTVEKESPSKYYSFDQMDATEYHDSSIIHSELQPPSSPLDPVGETGTKEWCQGPMFQGNDHTNDEDEGSLSREDPSDNFHSAMEDDQSILACLRSEERSDQSVTKVNTSPLPPVTTCDIMVGTEQAPCTSAFTQTEQPGTSDKNIITEVHMADLDYLAEEFIKLKTAKELREQKEEMRNSGCKLRKECDCIQRAQQAELCLLALQYSMCRQHCWRLYYTSAEGDQLTALPQTPPANMFSVLQKLESDFNHMREKILAGVPLGKLKPLSVDCEKVTTGASYTPAQVIVDNLGKDPSGSQEPLKPEPSGEEKGGSDNQSGNGSQHSQKKEERIKENSKASRAATLILQDRNAFNKAHKPGEKQSAAASKELNASEAWYDAEEDLGQSLPAESAATAETGQDPIVTAKDEASESAKEEAKSSVLFVSNLPSHVTEGDVLLWFEKYRASEVNISALKNGLRVAIVMISGLQSAEAAVRELNGCCMQSHVLHVEHINKAAGGSQSRASDSISGSESAQDATNTQSDASSSTERKLITQPPLSSSIKNRKVVCISPTTKGTCVPQHYCTMGSFNTLMAELTQRHPDVSRQRIVDALIELKAEHHGVLSGLPLRTIRDMTSELLTRPASAAQL